MPKKEKRELVLYAVEAEKYKETLPGKRPGELAGDSSKDKMHKALADFMLILSKHGRTWPEPSDYEEYRAGKPDNQTTNQNVQRIEGFFAWLEQQRRENADVAEEYVQQDLFGKSGAGIEEPESLGAIEADTVQGNDEPATEHNGLTAITTGHSIENDNLAFANITKLRQCQSLQAVYELIDTLPKDTKRLTLSISDDMSGHVYSVAGKRFAPDDEYAEIFGRLLWLYHHDKDTYYDEIDRLQALEAGDFETLPGAKKEPSQGNEEKPASTCGGKRANAGRKRLDESGEIRNVKMTVYMTESTAADFQALCLLKHANSTADYVLGLIKGEIAKNEKALSFFREAEKLIE